MKEKKMMDEEQRVRSCQRGLLSMIELRDNQSHPYPRPRPSGWSSSSRGIDQPFTSSAPDDIVSRLAAAAGTAAAGIAAAEAPGIGSGRDAAAAGIGPVEAAAAEEPSCRRGPGSLGCWCWSPVGTPRAS